MFSSITSAALCGIDACVVNVETDVGCGLPTFDMSGYLGAEVKEAKERVRIAIKNSGIELPPQRIVVNISPADIRKEGTGFDLPIAVGILTSNGRITESGVKDTLIVGELSLDGSVNAVNGVLPMVCAAMDAGIRSCIIPADNMSEGSIAEGIQLYGVRCLTDVINILNNNGSSDEKITLEVTNNVTNNTCNANNTNNVINDTSDDVSGSVSYGVSASNPSNKYYKSGEHDDSDEDFLDIRGQYIAKRATLIAACGMHNVMYIGPPGSGKTMLAKRIPTILPDMTYDEQLEVTKIYSVAGKLDAGKGLITKRPFRSPHHTITAAAMLGGGRIPRPGEITLAGSGVLFLDEMTEFKPDLMESLRQPLEDKKITIVRLNAAYTYPSEFMLAAAINPCKCGYYPDRNRCHCSEYDIRRYIGRISNPMWDRFDICVKVDEVAYEDIAGTYEDREDGYVKCKIDTNETDTNEVINNNIHTIIYSSSSMKEIVEKVRHIQQERFRNSKINYNSQMSMRDIKKYCILEDAAQEVIASMYDKLSMSARSYGKVLKVARTIADIEESEIILKEHISEALFYKKCEVKPGC